MKKNTKNFSTRRDFLKRSAALGVMASLPFAYVTKVLADGTEVAMAYSVNTLSSPSQAQQVRGGNAFALSVGADLDTLLTGGNSEKGIADVRAILAKYQGRVALVVDPLDSPDAQVIIEECNKVGAKVVTIWNKPDDLHPWNMGSNYVAHISFDGIESGRIVANAMFDAMGGKGGVLGLGGIANNVPAIDRKAGLMQAIDKNGGNVELLDFQVGDWASSKAFSITQAWLTRYGDDMKGIWAANDEMAFGAIQALTSEGLNGKVKVCSIDGTPPAIDAVMAGDLVCSDDWSPYQWGGLALSLAYRAATGDYDPSAQGNERREFYGKTSLIDGSNVKQVKMAKSGSPKVDYDKIWEFVGEQIRN
jgi:ribose transport system substrate-binding protein